jgi:hypothetical protein
MKVLFFPVYMATPHFEAELELMHEHLLRNDDVFIVHCKSELTACFGNPDHKKHICILCQSIFKNGIKLLNDKRINIIEIPFPQNRYPEIPLVFETIDDLKKFKIGNAEIGLGAASSLISRLNREHRLDTIKHRDIVFNEVNNAYYVYVFFKKIILDINPDMVYLFNGRFSNVLPVINTCEELKIPYHTHDRAGTLNKYRLVRNSLPHDLEKIHEEIEKTWLNTDENERFIIGNKFYTDRRKGIEHSWYSFTKEQKLNSLPSNFDGTKKNIGFFNSTIEEYSAIRGWDNPIKIYKEEIIAFHEIFEALKDDHNIHIYLRVHPNLKGFDNSQIREIKTLEGEYKNVTIILPESFIDSYALMENCDSIITFGSTIGVEACNWNKPSILLGNSLYGELDCCYIPNSHQETIDLIRTELVPKNKIGALKYGLWELSNGTEFKYFKQTGLTSGTFLGKTVKYSNPAFIKAAFSYLLTLRTGNDLLSFLNTGCNIISQKMKNYK